MRDLRWRRDQDAVGRNGTNMPRGELELPAFQGCVPAMLAVLGIDLHIAVGVAGRALFVQRREYLRRSERRVQREREEKRRRQ